MSMMPIFKISASNRSRDPIEFNENQIQLTTVIHFNVIYCAVRLITKYRCFDLLLLRLNQNGISQYISILGYYANGFVLCVKHLSILRADFDLMPNSRSHCHLSSIVPCVWQYLRNGVARCWRVHFDAFKFTNFPLPISHQFTPIGDKKIAHTLSEN